MARDPTRKLSYVACVSNYDSIKMGLRFPFEGLLEREAMVLLDVDGAVRSFHAQPETFRWRPDGRARHYTPDLLVECADGGKIYLEVKPGDRIDPGMDGRRTHIEAECRERGASFAIWSGDRIRGGHRLSGAKRVVAGFAYLSGAGGQLLKSAVEAAVERVGLPADLGELVAASGVGRVAEGAILGMVALGMLQVDLDLALSDASAVGLGLARGGALPSQAAGVLKWL